MTGFTRSFCSYWLSESSARERETPTLKESKRHGFRVALLQACHFATCNRRQPAGAPTKSESLTRAELALGFKSGASSIPQQLEAKQTSNDRGRLSTGRD